MMLVTEGFLLDFCNKPFDMIYIYGLLQIVLVYLLIFH